MTSGETNAHARLATRLGSSSSAPPRSCLATLRSEWPLMLRSTAVGIETLVADWVARDARPAQVHLASAGAGPLGGDRLNVEVHVGAGSSLVLSEVSPTLLLPGPHGRQSRTRVDIAVGPGASLVWLPQLVIAAANCHHRSDVHISLARDARLLLREEVLFGRSGETPGTFAQRLRITLDDRPLYDQEVTAGPHAPGWSGPARTAGHRAAGNLIVVDDGVTDLPSGIAHERDRGAAAVMPLAGPGVAASALAADTATLRTHLDTALAGALGNADGSPRLQSCSRSFA